MEWDDIYRAGRGRKKWFDIFPYQVLCYGKGIDEIVWDWTVYHTILCVLSAERSHMFFNKGVSGEDKGDIRDLTPRPKGPGEKRLWSARRKYTLYIPQ